MGDAVPQAPWDLPPCFPEWMLFALLDPASAVQSICLLGGQGSPGMEPERRCKSGMDGGLMAASLITSPPLYLRTAVFLSNQPGPPHSVAPLIPVGEGSGREQR
jgi:hypothetical protein